MKKVLARLFTLRAPPPPALRWLAGAGTVALILAAWWLLTLGATPEERVISPVVLPSPLEVAANLPSLINERGLLDSIIATLFRVVSGFLLAIAIGVPVGILAGSFLIMEAAAAPLSLFGRNIPIAALVPLTMLWFGIGETQKIIFIFVATVPFVFADTVNALLAVHNRYVETAETLGATKGQIIRKVLIPLALPDISTSLRLLFGLAFGYIMLAELVNTPDGLGALLNNSQRRGIKEDIYLILLVIGLLAYGIDRLLFFFHRGIFIWREKA